MRVLVACEFSGIVRDAFVARGHDALSVDLLASERVGPHYTNDVRDVIKAAGRSPIARFDLMIAFPPCTYLAVSGARWWKEREGEQREALEFVRFLLGADIPCIALENPIGKISTAIRKPDQIIQPWQFGHPETKATCLWLKNLPHLVPTDDVSQALAHLSARQRHRVHHEPPGADRWKNRSRTLVGIADAMAAQWGGDYDAAVPFRMGDFAATIPTPTARDAA